MIGFVLFLFLLLEVVVEEEGEAVESVFDTAGDSPAVREGVPAGDEDSRRRKGLLLFSAISVGVGLAATDGEGAKGLAETIGVEDFMTI